MPDADARVIPCSPPPTVSRGAPRVAPLLLLEAALVVAWSSGFVGTRFSIDHAPAFLVVFWRCVVVTLVLLPWAIGALGRVPAAVLLRHAGIGLLGVLMVTRDALAWGDAPLWAYGLPLLGMLSLAVATLWQKQMHAEASLGLLPSLWLQCAVSAVAFAGLAGREGSLMPVASVGFAVSVSWTVVLSTLGGYGLYWACLRRSSPTRVASVLYLSPAVTLLWAWAMFGEPLSWLMLLGTGVSGLGIWLVARSERALPAGASRRER